MVLVLAPNHEYKVLEHRRRAESAKVVGTDGVRAIEVGSHDEGDGVKTDRWKHGCVSLNKVVTVGGIGEVVD